MLKQNKQEKKSYRFALFIPHVTFLKAGGTARAGCPCDLWWCNMPFNISWLFFYPWMFDECRVWVNNNLTVQQIFFGCYLLLRSVVWRGTALIQGACCIIRLILMSTAPQMDWPAGRQWVYVGWGGAGGGYISAVCLVSTSRRCGWTRRGKNQTSEGKKSQKMFHAPMSLGRRKQSCNPILIAVDLLNRSSRFKSQQITQTAQGDVERGGRRGLRNQVHLRWYGSFLTSQDWRRGVGGSLKYREVTSSQIVRNRLMFCWINTYISNVLE